MSEHALQNAGRNALAGKCINFRVNVGQAWTGESISKLPNGDILIKNPRPFNTGLPAGFSDTFGVTPVEIVPEMVGKIFGHAHFVEYKMPGARISQQQRQFITAMRDNGARAGIARSVEDALTIALGMMT